MQSEILKEAVEYGKTKKWIAYGPLLPGDKDKDGSEDLVVSRAQL